jgi:hypothetical protein
MGTDNTNATTNSQSDHEWRWSRQGVEQRIGAMSPSDAFLTVVLFNARHANDVSKHLDSGACLSGLSPSEAHDIRARATALRQSATGWGEKYWAERLREARTGIKDISHDEAIMKEMAAAHPGFSVESLEAVYLFGLVLAR